MSKINGGKVETTTFKTATAKVVTLIDFCFFLIPVNKVEIPMTSLLGPSEALQILH